MLDTLDLPSLATRTVALAVGLAAVAGAVFSVRALYRLVRPVRITPGVRLFFGAPEPDEITATLTNHASEPIYIVRAVARCTYAPATIVLRHLRHPLLSPRLYPNLRYSPPTFELLPRGTQQKVEPFERIVLRHRLSKHPLSVFCTPGLLVEVQLSTGRRFQSSRIEVPGRWRFRPQKARPPQEASPSTASTEEA